jgi:hypothetical protein
LFEASLLAREEREAFVALACAGDMPLYLEVKSLLSYYDGSPDEPAEGGRPPSAS